jgi:hypothetical protein
MAKLASTPKFLIQKLVAICLFLAGLTLLEMGISTVLGNQNAKKPFAALGVGVGLCGGGGMLLALRRDGKYFWES